MWCQHALCICLCPFCRLMQELNWLPQLSSLACVFAQWACTCVWVGLLGRFVLDGTRVVHVLVFGVQEHGPQFVIVVRLLFVHEYYLKCCGN